MADHNAMLGEFARGNFVEAKSLAEEILAGLPVDETDYQQCRAVQEDRVPEELWTFYLDPENPPEGYGEWGEEGRRSYYLKLQAERLPSDFAAMSEQEKIEWLVDCLDRVWLANSDSPGRIDPHTFLINRLENDLFVSELIKVGNAAVSALVEVIKSDHRLTRTVFEDQYGHSRSYRAVSVREAAMAALVGILKFQVVDVETSRSGPYSGDELGRRLSLNPGEEFLSRVVAAVEDFVESYGHLPMAERLMGVITDDELTLNVRRRAAIRLLCGENYVFESLPNGVFALDTYYASPAPVERPHPLIAKFSDPSVAEELVALLREELVQLDASELEIVPSKNLTRDQQVRGAWERRAYRRERVERGYVNLIHHLQDARIVAQLEPLFQETQSEHMCRMYATMAAGFGDLGPCQVLADELRSGKLKTFEGPDGHVPLSVPIDRKQAAELGTRITNQLNLIERLAPEEFEKLAEELQNPEHPLHEFAKDLP